MIRTRCYRFRLRPTREQEQQFRQWAGCRRVVWNYFLQRRQAYYKETGKTLSYQGMCQELTLLKQHPDFAFLNDCDSQALQQVLRDLCCAYDNFFAKRARFPRRKSRKRTPNAFRIPQRVKIEGSGIYLPKIGLVEAVLHRPVEGDLKSATVKQEPSGKWTIIFVCHFDGPEPATGEPIRPVGLDAGLVDFYTTSEGDKTPAPKFYRKQERKLGRANRALSRKKPDSRNRTKAKNRLSVLHARVRNQREDWLHKRSRELCDTYDFISIEDLAVSALTKTKLGGHSKSWTDAAWGAFGRQLEYKQDWLGNRLVAVSRWYPSSQECHVCHQYTKHDLSTRTWTCPYCGSVHDRDHNAAINTKVEGLRTVAGGNPETRNVCRATIRLPKWKRVVMKQKTSNCEVRSPRL